MCYDNVNDSQDRIKVWNHVCKVSIDNKIYFISIKYFSYVMTSSWAASGKIEHGLTDSQNNTKNNL